MKPTYKYSLILAAVAAGMTSCSSDDLISKGDGNEGRTIHLNLTATKEAPVDAETRSALTENAVGGLDFAWTKGDRIIVTTDKGVVKGTLSLIGEGGKATGEFEGDLTGVQGTNVKFNYYFVGTENNEADIMDLLNYSHSYAEQRGTADSMDDYDIMSSSAAMELTGIDSYSLKMEFKRRVSNAKFELRLPKGVEYPVTVTLSGEELNNKVILSYEKADASCVTFEKGDIKVVVPNAGEDMGDYIKSDIFVTHLPTTAAYVLNFTAVDNSGKSYTGSYNISRAVVQNEYFRKRYGEGETATYGGLPVDFTAVAQNYTLIYAPNYVPTTEGNKEYKKDRDGYAEFKVQTYDLFTRADYEIEGWNTEADGSGEAFEAGQTLVITWPTTTVTLYAQWKQKSYTWQFKWIDDPAIGTVSYGAKIEVGSLPKTLGTAFPTDNPEMPQYYQKNVKEGYDFLGWEYKGKMVGMNGKVYDKNEIVINSLEEAEYVPSLGAYRVYIYAKWQKKKYDVKITWQDNDGNTIQIETAQVDHGVEFPVKELDGPEPEEGYEFAGWVVKGSNPTEAAPEKITVTGNVDLVLVPSWNKKPVVVTPGYRPGQFK